MPRLSHCFYLNLPGKEETTQLPFLNVHQYFMLDAWGGSGWSGLGLKIPKFPDYLIWSARKEEKKGKRKNVNRENLP